MSAFVRNAREIVSFSWYILRSRTQRRHLSRWWASLRENYLLDTPSPWIVFDAIDFIAGRIRPNWKIFEYGSGGSTLYWLSKAASCTSVEHDERWYHVLKSRLLSDADIDYRFVPPVLLEGNEKPVNPNISNPDLYLSGSPLLREHSFQKYVQVIDNYPDNYFDLVLVDGRSRPACVKHSLPKLKPGGLLILDNADRPYYLETVRTALTKYQKHEFIGVIPTLSFYVQTNIYVKPNSLELG